MMESTHNPLIPSCASHFFHKKHSCRGNETGNEKGKFTFVSFASSAETYVCATKENPRQYLQCLWTRKTRCEHFCRVYAHRVPNKERCLSVTVQPDAHVLNKLFVGRCSTTELYVYLG